MATQVTSELKEGLLDQLYEIERQIRQSRGYPFDPERLRRHLQEAIEGKFVSPNLTEFFRTREGLWVSKEFRDRILTPALASGSRVPANLGRHFDLPHDMSDIEIGTELGDGYIFEDARAFCATLAQMLDTQWGGTAGPLLANGKANIFYVRDVNEKVFAVLADWSSDVRTWGVDADRLDDNPWDAGFRAFPRN